VYEPVKDSGGAGADGLELTPIFRALTRGSSDPSERFRSDPLEAPLPAPAQAAPASNRMMLQPVPNSRPESTPRRPAHAAPPERQSSASARHAQPAAAPSGSGGGVAADPGGRGGRHRVLRSVGRHSAPGGGIA
jgi:hypothetical protein